jgi:hypothetical protein
MGALAIERTIPILIAVSCAAAVAIPPPNASKMAAARSEIVMTVPRARFPDIT